MLRHILAQKNEYNTRSCSSRRKISHYIDTYGIFSDNNKLGVAIRLDGATQKEELER